MMPLHGRHAGGCSATGGSHASVDDPGSARGGRIGECRRDEPQPSVVAQEATPAADLEANKALARRWHELFTQGNVEAVDEILTADFVWRTPPPYVVVRGRTGVKAAVTETRAFLHDLELTEEDVIAEGDRVVIRWSLRATAQTESGPYPVTFTGIDIFRIEDGQLAELWQNSDDRGLEAQLAVAAELGTPPVGTPMS